MQGLVDGYFCEGALQKAAWAVEFFENRVGSLYSSEAFFVAGNDGLRTDAEIVEE